jgi:hypothetical protein
MDWNKSIFTVWNVFRNIYTGMFKLKNSSPVQTIFAYIKEQANQWKVYLDYKCVNWPKHTAYILMVGSFLRR